MTPEFPQNDREKLEAKLTALLLGELPAHEAAALHRAMDDDPDLAALYDRLKRTIELVRESADGPAKESAESGVRSAELKLSPDRRENLLAHFKTVTPKEFAPRPQKNRTHRRIFEWAAVAAVALFFVYLAIPNFVRSRETARKSTLINNLRLFDGAKQTWALEANKSGNATPQMAEIMPYLGRGGEANTNFLTLFPPIEGETYVLGKASESPSIEMSVRNAKKMFGSEVVAKGEQHDGRVRLSLEDLAPSRAVAEAQLQRFADARGEFARENAAVSQQALSRGTLSDVPRTSGAKAEAALTSSDPSYKIYADSFSPVTGVPITGQLPLPKQSASAPPPPPSQTQIVLPSSNEAGNVQLALNSTPAPVAWDTDTQNKVGNTTLQNGVSEGESIAELKKEFKGRTQTIVLPSQNESAGKDLAELSGQQRELITQNSPGTRSNRSTDESFSFYTDLNRDGKTSTNGLAGEPEWTGVLQRPAELHSNDNQFISRYAYTVVPQIASAESATNHTFTADDFFQTSSASFSAVTNLSVSGESYNPQVAYRMLARLGSESGGSNPYVHYTNLDTGTHTSVSYNPAGSIGNANIMIEPDSRNLVINADPKTTEAIREIVKNLNHSNLNQEEDQLTVADANIGTGTPNRGNIVLPPGQTPNPNNQQLAWSSVDGTTNAPVAFYRQRATATGFYDDNASTSKAQFGVDLAGSNSFAGSTIVNAGNVQGNGIPERSQFTGGVVTGPIPKEYPKTPGVTVVNADPTLIQKALADFAASNSHSTQANQIDEPLTLREQNNNPTSAAFGNSASGFGGEKRFGGGGFGGGGIGGGGFSPGQASKTHASATPARQVEIASVAPQPTLSSSLPSKGAIEMVTNYNMEPLSESAGQAAKLPRRSETVTTVPHVNATGLTTARGGKQVELAAAANAQRSSSENAEQSRPTMTLIQNVGQFGLDTNQIADAEKSSTNKALGFEWYLGNKVINNQQTADSGTTMPTNPHGTFPGNLTARTTGVEAQKVRRAEAEIKADEVADEQTIKSELASLPSNVYDATVVGYVNYTNTGSLTTVPPTQLAFQDQKQQQAKVDELRKLKPQDAFTDSTGPSPSLAYKTLDQLLSEKVTREAEYQDQARLLQGLKAMKREELKEALPVAVNDSQLSSLLSELDLAQQSLVKLKPDYSPDNPNYQRAQDLVNNLSNKVDGRVDGILLGLQTKVDADRAFLDSVTNTVESAKQADIATAKRDAPYYAAFEKLQSEKHWLEILKMKTGEEAVDSKLPSAPMVNIIDPAKADTAQKSSLGEKIRQTLSGNVERMARITLEEEHPDIPGMERSRASQSYDPYFLQTEFQVIQSDVVLKGAAAKLNSDKNGKADVTIAQLKKDLDLHPEKNSKVIDIGVKTETAEDAARIANAVADAYRQYRLDQYDENKNHGLTSLRQQFAEQQKNVELAQAKVDELRKELNISDVSVAVASQPVSAAQQTDTALAKPAEPPPTPQPEVLTSSNAFSTFSLNVSDVSFKLAAATLEKGQMPEPASIRSEEFINAFDYRDPEAAPGVPVAFNSERALYPFAHNRELLRFSLKTAAAGRQAGRPLNIVLLLDNSGSMERADRVNIIREALRVLAAQLQPQDTFSVVTFARTARLRVDGIPGNQAAAAAEEIAKLTPEGGTNLGEALDTAYETALHHYLANGDNRVIMLTDGAANLGDVDPDSLKQKVEAQRKQGISLDCFGIGWEGYNDDLLEVLTRDGNGRYGFVNTPEEASTEFVAQIAGALNVAAQDVKVQVEFNPNRVTSYRQIGYAKHQLTKEQFRDNTVAAAQIAAQETGNALYTIEINPQGEGSIGTVRVRYKVPATGEIREQAWDVPYTGTAMPLEQASPAMRLAATATAFSEWLATSPFADEVTTDQLLNYLNGVPQVYGADTRPQKLEWMIRQAKSISGK